MLAFLLPFFRRGVVFDLAFLRGIFSRFSSSNNLFDLGDLGDLGDFDDENRISIGEFSDSPS